MNCFLPASTGLPLLALLSVAGICVAAGVLALILARSRRGKVATALVLLLLISGGLTAALTASPPVEAATLACPSAATGALTITQTSHLTGLRPGVGPAAITGVVVNHSRHSLRITTVTVSIASVSPAAMAAPGGCDASDYMLLRPVMPVGRLLAPGDSVAFAGAAIGFRDKAVNQDACQRASVGLRYVSS